MNSAAQNDDALNDDDKAAPASPSTLRWPGLVVLALLLGWGLRNWTAQNAAQPLPLGPVVEESAPVQNVSSAATVAPGNGIPSPQVTAPAPPPAPAQGATITVHVAGAVNSPGVYVLPANARVGEAVARAGGVSFSGDGDSLNLAAALRDGQRIEVPVKSQPAGPPNGYGAVPSGPGPLALPLSPGKRSPSDLSRNPLDLNLATVEQLSALPGVGPALATRIVNYRLQHNGFRSVAELEQVPGFGSKRLAELQPLLFVR